MTEREGSAVSRTSRTLVIGPSAMVWDGSSLLMHLREVSAPIPRPIAGTVRVWPSDWSQSAIGLDGARRHTWTPVAPRTRVEVMLREPETHWSGWGYLDSNRGDEPLERAFRDWHWSRSHLPDGRAAIFYDLRMQTGEFVRNQLWFGAGTSARPEQEPIPANLPATRVWRVGRSTWADPGARPRVVRTLEDTPFYARSLLGLDLQGLPTVTVHESLHLQRLSAPGVRLMLPFRMPRRPRFLALR